MPQLQPKAQKNIISEDEKRKTAIKEDADSHHNAKDCKLSENYIVLVRQPHKDKLSTPFSPKPLCITNRKGSMSTAEDGSGH